jgi:hypothetical protein
MNQAHDTECQIFSGDLLAKALRDSGYKNTAYAIAELIDNSIQAEAHDVEVFCFEKYVKINDKERRRICQIAVLDNGIGMEDDILRRSLRFGDGTRLKDRSGIGRFGMGLPNASCSQAKRVEIWSWVNGPTNALWTYIDLDEISSNMMFSVPKPVQKDMPNEIISHSKQELSDSGTLVIWMSIDDERLTWKTARSTLQHTEELIGRIYRKFLAEYALKIRLVAFDSNESVIMDIYARPNDPLYLLNNTTTPTPFDSVPMFQQWGEDEEIEVEWKGERHKVVIRFSYAKQETVPPIGDRGHTPYGKHAAKNLGVSLIRAKRELSLEASWANSYDPVERWWGCEVEFSPQLDEVFGVTINKQAATLWNEFAQLDITTLAEDGEQSPVQIAERLKSEEDPRGILLEIAEYIRKQIPNIQTALKNQTKGRRSKDKRHEEILPDEIASEKFRRRAEENPVAKDSEDFNQAACDALKTDLVTNKKYSEEAALEIATAVLKKNLKVVFVEAELDGFAFFKVEEKPGGVAQVIFNSRHLFFERLYKALSSNEGDESEISSEMTEANIALGLLFAAWARYERESPEKVVRELTIVREDWGRMVSKFLTEDED